MYFCIVVLKDNLFLKIFFIMEITDIKSKLTLAQVLHYYHLKPDKNLRLCCPFHDDKTPSMQVYYKTHTAFCFSSNCKTHGKAIDALDFIMLMENITKHEAIKKAVEMIGGEGKTQAIANRSTTLTKIFTYFKNGVSNSPPAKQYLATRHLSHEVIEVGFNSGQFHYKVNDAQEALQEYISLGLLLEMGVNSRFGKPAFKPFGKHCIVFGLRDRDLKIVSLYFRSTIDDKNQRHFYLKDRQGLYPSYPKAETKKLILTESIIDTATLMMIESIKSNYEILSLYGTNGLTDEHQKAIKEWASPSGEMSEGQRGKEIIFFLNGDEPGVKAVQKYAPMLKVEMPGVKITNVEVPQNEDVNSLLNGHSEEILTHLINSRKECNFLFSNEENTLFSNEKEKVQQAEDIINTATPANQEEVKTDSHPSEVSRPKGLDAQNPYNLKYKSEAAQYQIKGFKIDQMDSLKITLQISI